MNYADRIKQCEALKKELDTYRPLSAHVRKQLKQYYRIGLTYSSNALEGNTLTESETKVVLEDGITIGGKPLRDHMEALGHAQAYDLLYTLVNQNHAPTEADILALHQAFYQPIDPSQAGVYRKQGVIITGSQYIPPAPAEIPSLMADFATHIALWKDTKHPVEYAALLHFELVRIHPFYDGNGRTARLLMNMALLQEGYCIAIIPPVVRQDYLAILNQANTKSPPEATSFVNFISHQVEESLKDMLRMVKALKAD